MPDTDKELLMPPSGFKSTISPADPLDTKPLDSDTVSGATVTQEASTNVEAVKEGGSDGTDTGVQDAGGRGGEVPAVLPAVNGVGEAEAGSAVVDEGEQSLGTLTGRYAEQKVSTPFGVFTVAQLAGMKKEASPKQPGKTHGKMQAQHGVHLEAPKAAGYQCADCQDLLRRVVKAFKELGYEFK